MNEPVLGFWLMPEYTDNSGYLPQPSMEPDDVGNTQLSGDDGVCSDVSSVALNPGLLGGTSKGNQDSRSASRTSKLQPGAATLTDADLMLQVKDGDDSAFEYLVEKYRRPMLGFMYRVTRNTHLAEELAQEVFLRVYRARSTYNAEAKFSTWLYRIASNLSVNYIRDTKYERPEMSVSLDEPDEETGTTMDLADKSINAEQDLIRRERLAAIKKHVQALPERQRNAVFMHKYQGMDYKQISEVLNISESATKSLLFRAYETLRERLKEFI
ncbi:MAG TPA: RNA polymerase sigma factor [Terriglobales bacterium]|nr:RNA polymerase sigma factor [Terriglobales bacterium]